MLYKNTLVKIRKSFGRYISILIIVLVGVGFYAGIQSSAPDVTDVADKYFREQKLMDIKIVSSLGLTNEDVSALKALNGINAVIPSYSLDVLNEKKAVRVHSLEDEVNIISIIEGRKPQNESECVADATAYKVGDVIHITSDESKNLKNTAFTVTGTVRSVLYIADDYGSTTVGDGKLASFLFVDKSNFTLEAFTEIYLIAAGANSEIAYSEGYDSIVAKLRNSVVDIKSLREAERLQEIKNKANEEIAKNEEKLNGEKAKGEAELQKAKKELDDAAAKLKDAKAELDKSEDKLQASAKEKAGEIALGKNEIAKGWKSIDSALIEAGIDRSQIDKTAEDLNAAISGMAAQLEKMPPDSPEYDALRAQFNVYKEKHQGLLLLKESAERLSREEKKLDEGEALFNFEIDKAKKEIAKGRKEIEANERKLNDGLAEYEENFIKFNKEISDAQGKIEEARAKAEDIEKPKWYISDRNDASGYSQLKGGIQVISSVAAVFPFFFILIVILMTSNSMARMIAEERSELGTLASLGYSDVSIVVIYLLYVLSASGIGAAAGFFIGCRFIPPLVYANFRYSLPSLTIHYDMTVFAVILTVSLALMTLVTIVGCIRELKEKPAALLRPLPPKHGQKILLERIGLIWNRLSFTWKITMRNMFRYKKRAFMTIVGVAGCTSFLVVGFGLRDSMDGVAQKQYGEIFHYDNMMILKEETPNLKPEIGTLLKDKGVENPLLIKQSALKGENQGLSLDAYLVVPYEESVFDSYFSLKSTVTGNSIKLEPNGAVITQRLAKELNLKKGDSLTVKDFENNNYTLKVNDIAENYISHYIYMLPSAYSSAFGGEPLYNTVVSKSQVDNKKLAENLIDSGEVINTVFAEDVIKQAVDSNDSLNNIIVLLVFVASLLALIVLYNLTAINISERTREIATLKVLGFRDAETNAYIYREALVLTVISIGIGMLLGVVLHRFVVGVIESGFMGLLHKINPLSFVVSALLTLAFSVMMQVITYFKLKTVDMIESLKSVE